MGWEGLKVACPRLSEVAKRGNGKKSSLVSDLLLLQCESEEVLRPMPSMSCSSQMQGYERCLWPTVLPDVFSRPPSSRLLARRRRARRPSWRLPLCRRPGVKHRFLEECDWCPAGTEEHPNPNYCTFCLAPYETIRDIEQKKTA